MTQRPRGAPAPIAATVATARRRFDQALAAGRRELARSLTQALGIRSDHVLQAMIRRAAKASVTAACVLRLGDDPVWLRIGAGRTDALARSVPRGAASITLPDMLRIAPRLETVIEAAATPALVSQAQGLADDAFGQAAPSPDTWAALEPWSALLEGPAYRVALRLAAAVEDLGVALRRSKRPAPEALALYWEGLELLRRCSGFACRVEGRARLTEIAGRFDWSAISPSWPMIRHRSLGLSASAARAAAAFGPEATPNYFRRLEGGRSRLERFDALFALTAIGLAEPEAARGIRRDLQRSADAGAGHDADMANALATLDGGLRARNASWLLQAHLGRSTPVTEWRDVLLCDPLLELPDGSLAGFAGLSDLAARQVLVSAPKPQWYRRVDLKPHEVRTLIDRSGRGR